MKKTTKNNYNYDPPVTLMDSFYLGILEAVLAIPTAVIIWFLISAFMGYTLPAESILWFCGVFFLIGSIFNTHIFDTIYIFTWEQLLGLFGVERK